MKTKAAVLYSVGAPLQMEELELAPPGKSEIRVRWVASGVCHSDYSVWDGTLKLPLPAVLGHEGAGIVEELGEGVTGLAPGDPVIASLTPQCGVCVFCREHKPYLCAQMRKGLNEGALPSGLKPFRNAAGEGVGQLMSLGTFAERSVIPAGAAVKVDSKVPLGTTCLIGCGVTTGVGAALNTARIQPGDSVAVIGCGGVGLSILQGAKIAGAGMLIAIDPVPEKRELALSLGATHALDPNADNVVKAVRKLTGMGVHFAFEALGRKQTIEQAWALARPTGSAVIVGVPRLDTVLDLPVAGFFGEKRFCGSAYGSSTPSRDIPRYVDLFMRGELKLDAMITRRIGIAQVNEAFAQMGRGEGARTVIEYAA